MSTQNQYRELELQASDGVQIHIGTLENVALHEIAATTGYKYQSLREARRYLKVYLPKWNERVKYKVKKIHFGVWIPNDRHFKFYRALNQGEVHGKMVLITWDAVQRIVTDTHTLYNREVRNADHRGYYIEKEDGRMYCTKVRDGLGYWID